MRTTTNAFGMMLALSLALAGPAVAQNARPAARPAASVRSPLTMDVAGVRLGMPLAGARAVLAGTYRCDRIDRAASFRQLVDIEVAKRKGVAQGFPPNDGAIGELDCNGPSGEHLRVFMAQTPSGEVVHRIQLFMSNERIDPLAIARQIDGKYGRPTEGTAVNGSWCVGRCAFDWAADPRPRLTTRSDASTFNIWAIRGRDARDADDAAVAAVAAREAPVSKRGAF